MPDSRDDASPGASNRVPPAVPEPGMPREIFADEIPARGRIGGFVIGVCGVKQAEALMVFGSQHGVLHAGFPCHARPQTRIVVYRIKGMKIFFILRPGDFVDTGIPFPSGRNSVESPVDKQAETGLLKPFCISHCKAPPSPEDRSVSVWRRPPQRHPRYNPGKWCRRCGSARQSHPEKRLPPA